jgi:uncharacterized RDD family membrane protein YckC
MSPIDELLTVDTPENVSFDFEIAGIGSRFLAALVDSLFILLLQILALLIGVLVAVSIDQYQGSVDTFLQDHLGWVLGISGLISFIFLWGYYIFFEMVWNGQSPGKRMAKLRVIRVDGRPITLAESLIRNLVRLIDFLPGFYGVGVVTMFIHPQSRRLGDLAAGTLVVHDKGKAVSLASLETPGIPIPLSVNTGASEIVLPLERLSSSDLQMVEDFLQRQKQLENAEALGSHLLNYLWQKMELPAEALPRQSAMITLAAIYHRNYPGEIAGIAEDDRTF